MDVGRARQAAVITAYLAAGLLVGALILLQAQRVAAGDVAFWNLLQSS